MIGPQLIGFFERAASDLRLSPFHLSLYLALLYAWQASDYCDSFSVTKTSLQRYARIGSAHTLYRCMRELADWGYIAYAAGRGAARGSCVSLVRLHPRSSAQNSEAPVEKTASSKGVPANLNEVSAFFSSKGYPAVEARRFFNHFQSNGWRVGGRSPMRNWKAAAENWMLNGLAFSSQPAQQSLNFNPSKSYDDPL